MGSKLDTITMCRLDNEKGGPISRIVASQRVWRSIAVNGRHQPADLIGSTHNNTRWLPQSGSCTSSALSYSSDSSVWADESFSWFLINWCLISWLLSGWLLLGALATRSGRNRWSLDCWGAVPSFPNESQFNSSFESLIYLLKRANQLRNESIKLIEIELVHQFHSSLKDSKSSWIKFKKKKKTAAETKYRWNQGRIGGRGGVSEIEKRIYVGAGGRLVGRRGRRCLRRHHGPAGSKSRGRIWWWRPCVPTTLHRPPRRPTILHKQAAMPEHTPRTPHFLLLLLMALLLLLLLPLLMMATTTPCSISHRRRPSHSSPVAANKPISQSSHSSSSSFIIISSIQPITSTSISSDYPTTLKQLPPPKKSYLNQIQWELSTITSTDEITIPITCHIDKPRLGHCRLFWIEITDINHLETSRIESSSNVLEDRPERFHLSTPGSRQNTTVHVQMIPSASRARSATLAN